MPYRFSRTAFSLALLHLWLLPLAARQQQPPAPSTPPDQLAERQAQLAAAEAKYPPNSPEVVGALIALVQRQTVVRKIGPETLAYAQRAVASAEIAKGKDSILYAEALSGLAKVYIALSQPETGRPMAEQALEIAQHAAPGTLEMAEVADALDKVCWELRDNACSLRAGEIAIEAVRASHTKNELYLASMLQDLAQVKLQVGDHAGARAEVLESLEIVNRQTKPAAAMTILESNAGQFFVREKQVDEALAHLRKSLDLSTQIYGADSIQVGYATTTLGQLYAQQGRYRESEKQYEDALVLFRKWYGPTHVRTAIVEKSYAEELAAAGVLPKALDVALRSHRTNRENYSLAIRVLPERQALLLSTGNMEDGLNECLSILVKHPDLGLDPAYQEVIRSRAIVAEEMAKRQASLNRNKDPQIQALLAELDKERAAVLASTSPTQPAGGAVQVWTEATARMERVERELAERSLQFREDQRVRTVALDDVRRNIPNQGVLISYVQYGRIGVEAGKMDAKRVRSYLAFVVHPGSDQLRIFDLGDGASIDALVQKCRAASDAEAHSGGLGSTRNERAYRAAGLALRKRIWDPLRNELAGAKLALVVPDGNLNLIPFSGLPEGQGYLVEHGPVIHLLTSERDLVPSDDSVHKAGLLAVGSPQFDVAENDIPDAAPLRDGPIVCDAFRTIQFRPLPGSAAEVTDIDSAWRRWNHDEDAALITGADATRARFLDEAARHRVLHVATHAFVLDKSCGNGNPLLHSGLVFAGVNQGRESAILTAQQIASLDLSGVDWAVLSACNTGNGILQDGEGVLGLERAFRVAGVHSVVMTLWPVDDNVTRHFMHDLYAQRFGHHASTADSVWTASRHLLLERRAAGKSTHPWYWAGFVGSGGWN